MNNVSPTSLIHSFRHFLLSTWPLVAPTLRDYPDWAEDAALETWMQANWELLVEARIMGPGQFLATYGPGADTGVASSRVLWPQKQTTHALFLEPASYVDLISGQPIGADERLRFEELVAWVDGWHLRTPPFDHVLASDSKGVERVVELDRMGFMVVAI